MIHECTEIKVEEVQEMMNGGVGGGTKMALKI